MPANLRTLYARRDLQNAEALIRWAKSQGFKTCLPPEKMHATIIYSKTLCKWSLEDDGNFSTIKPWHNMLTVKGGRRTVKPLGLDGAIVLTFKSSILKERWEDLHMAGAKSDYPTFTPHITISWNTPPDLTLSKIQPYTGPLLFGFEVFKEIDPHWQESLIEKAKRLTWTIP